MASAASTSSVAATSSVTALTFLDEAERVAEEVRELASEVLF